MRVFELLHYLYVVQLDIEELVHGFESTLDGDVVLHLNRDLMIDQSLEEAVELLEDRVFLVNSNIDPPYLKNSIVPRRL